MSREEWFCGRIFNRMKIIKRAQSDSGGIRVLCLCDCGSRKIVHLKHLKNGAIRSCGCYFREMLTKRNTKHNMSTSSEYKIWHEIKRRCRDQRRKNFLTYGLAGIIVCRRWDNFENFYNDMGPRPSKKHSIDRIDGTKGYFPSNCRWADAFMQANNKKNNHILFIRGRKYTMAEASRIFKINYSTLRSRLNRSKMTDEGSVTYGSAK